MTLRTVYRAILVAAFVAGAASDSGAAGQKHYRTLDKLLTFTDSFNAESRPTIDAKLLLTPASHGRMITLQGPPDIGESAVSIDCPELDARMTTCNVTLTRAQSNMADTMLEHYGETDALHKVKEIPVLRKDAEIPKTTATAFRNCLRSMIPREPGDPQRLHRLTMVDNDRVEFWLEEPNKPIRRGERAEYPGERTKRLIRIGYLLVRYCEVAPSERGPIAKQVEKEAARILSSKSSH